MVVSALKEKTFKQDAVTERSEGVSLMKFWGRAFEVQEIIANGKAF